MKAFFTRSIALFAVASFVSLVACSSSSSGTTADSCSSASQVANDCNAKQPKDGGTSVTITFDAQKCQQAGDNGKKVADCINANASNCDCIAKCSLTGAC